MRRCLEDGQVAAIDGVATERGDLFHEPPEVGVHFGRSARDVHDRDGRARQGIEAEPHRDLTHDLAPVGARVHVAVTACLVADLAQVELQHLNVAGAEGSETVRGELALELARDGYGAEQSQLLLGAGQWRPARL